MNPLIVIGAVALIGFLATLGGAAADENGATIINGNGGAGNGIPAPTPAPVLTATLNVVTT